jgi:membrane associated rhomboid family serine protease
MAFAERGYGGSGGFGFGYGLTPVVKRLLIANTAVFLVTFVTGTGWVVDWFAFQPGHLLSRPWGVFTYMFVHGGFMHLFFNMLALFFFGPALEVRWGSREFLKYYAIAGLGGVAMSFLFAPQAVIGASAAVYGVMLAFAMNWPNTPIYIWGIFPVQAKWLVGFLFVASVLSAFGGAGGGVAHFAHLGGLVTGLLYLKMDWRVPEAFEQVRTSTRKVRRLAIVPREDEDRVEHRQAAGDGWSQAEERQILDEVDRVLDKISDRGIASLTERERQLLDEVSRRRRTN